LTVFKYETHEKRGKNEKRVEAKTKPMKVLEGNSNAQEKAAAVRATKLEVLLKPPAVAATPVQAPIQAQASAKAPVPAPVPVPVPAPVPARAPKPARVGSTSLLGNVAVSAWSDSDMSDGEQPPGNYQQAIQHERMLAAEVARKRKLKKSNWDAKLDEGKLKKVKGKSVDDAGRWGDIKDMKPNENPFHRTQSKNATLNRGSAKGGGGGGGGKRSANGGDNNRKRAISGDRRQR
jgi:hypothetical protein